MESGTGHRVIEEWFGENVETLADLLQPNLRAVCVGINPSPISVDAGHYYQGKLGKAFFERLRRVGVLHPDVQTREDDVLFAGGIGFTDIIKRPTKRAVDLYREEFEFGRQQLLEKISLFEPKLILFTFKKTAEVMFGKFEGNGLLPTPWGGRTRAFVMPGPYEAARSTSVTLHELARQLSP